jgi:nucleoid-associated protein YgaU
MVSRYDGRKIAVNDEEVYGPLFEDRGIDSVRQYVTPELQHPTAEQVRTLENLSHTWETGDRYYKLATKYYDDPNYWWVIAWYNQRPTESMLSYGQVIKIPFPLHRVLRFMKG